MSFSPDPDDPEEPSEPNRRIAELEKANAALRAELRQITDALDLSEHRQEMALEASGAGVFDQAVPLEDGIYHSDRWAEILGLQADEIPPPSTYRAWIRGRIHPDDLPDVQRAYRAFLAGTPPTTFIVEYRLRHADGHWIWVRTCAKAATRDVEGRARRVVGVMMNITDQKQTEAALRKLNEQLEERVRDQTQQVRTLAMALTLAEQRERDRIARILHDELQQHLYSLQAFLSSLPTDALERDTALSRILEILDDAITVTRFLTVELSPPVLEDEGLVEALRWLGAQMEQQHGLRVTIQAATPPRLPNKDLRILLFQFTRELLLNVVQHAGVANARVDIEGEEDQIRLHVQDDGAGFDLSAVPRRDADDERFGLIGIQERLALLDGTLEIDTLRGRGTRITLCVPVD